MSTAPMHVVAAAFTSRDDAAAAERALRDALDLEDADLRLEGLGGDAARDGHAAVLGGRFRAHRTAFARGVLEQHGGVILTAVPEAWVGGSPRDSLSE